MITKEYFAVRNFREDRKSQRFADLTLVANFDFRINFIEKPFGNPLKSTISLFQKSTSKFFSRFKNFYSLK